MSDAGRNKREWRFYLEDMIEFSLKCRIVHRGYESNWLHREHRDL